MNHRFSLAFLGCLCLGFAPFVHAAETSASSDTSPASSNASTPSASTSADHAPFTNKMDETTSRNWNLTGKPSTEDKSWIEKGAKGGSDLDSLWILQSPQSQKRDSGEETAEDKEAAAMDAFAQNLFGLSSDKDKNTDKGNRASKAKPDSERARLNGAPTSSIGLDDTSTGWTTDRSDKGFSRAGWESLPGSDAIERSALLQKGWERSSGTALRQGLGEELRSGGSSSWDHAKQDALPTSRSTQEASHGFGNAAASGDIRPKIVDIRTMNAQERNALARDATLDPRIPRLQATPRAESTAPFAPQPRH